jgi:PPK2 family polyphosphate:nucleotide phosphotransferase
MQMNAVEKLKVPVGKKIDLKSYDPGWMPKWAVECIEENSKDDAKEEARQIIDANRQKLVDRQELFWANGTYAMLILLQGMDAAGKDGVISHVMSGVNPQGCEVYSFKVPNEEELNHDFLWRYVKVLPKKGRIGIFNRSYYEEVLVVKVHPEALEKEKLSPASFAGNQLWEKRYKDINCLEQHLVENGTIILKFFLNISKKKQKERLLERLEDPHKNWKFSPSDLLEREKWKDYMDAYEDALNETSTEWAPWYVIPADKKWVAHAAISEIIVSQIEALNLKHPALSKEQSAALKKAKADLEKE